MKLEDIDTSKFKLNPKSKTFLEDAEKYEEFNINIYRVNNKKLLTYMVLMYDEHSEIRDIHPLGRRKREAALISGFTVHEEKDVWKFYHSVEECLNGLNEKFNKALVKYLSIQFNKEFSTLVAFDHIYDIELIKSVSVPEKDTHTKLKTIKDWSSEIEKRLFGGDEVIQMSRALYEEVDRLKTDILRPEKVVEEYEKSGLMGFSQYGAYVPRRIDYAGDQIPEEGEV